jgi:hypothetical protein
MSGNIFHVNLFELVIFAVVLAATVRLFSFIWTHLLHVNIEPREFMLLGGSCIGSFIFLNRMGFGQRWTWGLTGFIIVGYFVAKLITRHFSVN